MRALPHPPHASYGFVGAGVALLAALLTTLTGLPAALAGASGWAGPKDGRVRLLAGMIAPAGAPRAPYAGIQIRLGEGWKTYWRHPGDAGVPPHLDWSGSSNLASATVLFPAPRRFMQAGLASIGYKGDVILPVAVTPIDPAKPVSLVLALEYGICKDICMPVEARLAVALEPGAEGDGRLIEPFLAVVPAAPADDLPSVKRVGVIEGAPGPRLVVEARYPRGTAGADLLVESEDGRLLPLPAIAAKNGSIVRFEARLAGPADAVALRGRTLRLTLLGEQGSSETRMLVGKD
jgi:DsbC/DsbD-like thiol-disulfide interchange protein